MALAQSSAAQKPNRKQRRQAERQARRQRAGRTSGQALLDRAREQHIAGLLDEAEAGYRRLLESSEEQPFVRSLLGALYIQRGQAPAAVSELERARASLPEEVSIHTNLGLAYNLLGQPEAADESFGRALALRPDDPEALKNLAGWLNERGRHLEAIPLLERALAAAPKDAARWNLLAQCYGRQGKAEIALEHALKAKSLAPADPQINGYLGMVLVHCGRFEEALTPFLVGFPAMGHLREYQASFLTILKCANYERYRPEMEQALLTCFDSGLIDVQRLSATAGAHVWLRYLESARSEATEDGRATRVHFDGILADELLVRVLGRTVNKCLGLEMILVPLRSTLLRQLRAETEMSPTALRFVVAFAMQCHNNSYIYPVSEADAEAVARLRDEIEQRLTGPVAPDPDLEIELALCAMYQPLHALEGFRRLLEVPLEAWSEALRPLLAVALHNPAEEQELRATIPAFGSIEDSVSQAVRSQYEENPYPRWTFLPSYQPLGFAAQMQIAAPWLTLPEDFEEPTDCLIAGCGTGRHPINAAAMMPDTRFLAVDLSLSSLAYAKRMARHHGIDNIEFRHGDLLEIAALGRDFSWIESAGVLHHMEHPERGLESLLGVLRPGGYLRLGLYSRLARSAINEARARIEALGLRPTAEDIRAFRRAIIAREEASIDQLVTLSDFFDLDSFRDLVFHVQEHQFTVPDLKAMLERQGLAFCGFIGLRPTVFQQFQRRFPEPASLTDMDCWTAFEDENPDSFIGMYEFWCRSKR